jgi:hypothetical protein
MLVALVAAIATLFGSMMMTAPANASELRVSQQQIEEEAQILDPPTVTKTVTADPDNEGDFNLSFSVTGKQDGISQTVPIDIILMVDNSYSMADPPSGVSSGTSKMANLKKAATSFIDSALELNSSEQGLVRIQLMSFAARATTNQAFSSSKTTLVDRLNGIGIYRGWGTDWGAAVNSISQSLESPPTRDGAQKVVVFMTDGEPYLSSEYEDAAETMADKADNIFNVGIDLDKEGAVKLNELTTFMGSNAAMIPTTGGTDNLSTAFEAILQTVTGKYLHSDVVITDTLSDYVEFVDVDASSVKLVTTDTDPPSYSATFSESKKTLTINFAKGEALKPGITYIFTVSIRATDAAYAASQLASYPNKGDVGTGTWAGQAGVYTNDNDASNVAYSVSLVDSDNKVVGIPAKGKSVALPRPVIQVTPAPATIALKGNKVIDKNDRSEYELGEGDFKVNLTGKDSKGDVNQTKANDEDGNFTFDSLTFNKAGEYTYNLSEVLPEGISTEKVSNGILYDSKDKTVTVEVKLVGKKFVASIVGGNDTDYSFSFTNVALGLAETALSATKVVLNNNGDGSVPLTDFEFGLYAKETEPDAISAQAAGDPIQTSPADSTGKITFDRIEYKQDGVHEYLICEIIPDGATDVGGQDSGYKYLNGILYDTTCAEASVTVELDEENKELVATKAPEVDHTFTNVRIVPIELSELAVTKSITGRDLVDGEFTFEMVDENDDVVATGKNTADGAVVFDKLPMASDTGAYEYTVREVVPGEEDDAYDAAITYDDSVHNISFGVTLRFDAEDPGNSVFEVAAEPEAVEFVNEYTAPDPISVDLGATKVLEDGTLKEGQFDFDLSDVAGDEASVVDTVSNAADGSITFGAVELTDADVENGRTLQMSEVIPEGASAVGVYNGIRYDQSLYDIVISVTRDKKTNTLHASVEGATDIVFTNLQLPVVPVDPPVIPDTPVTPDTPTTDPVSTPGTTVSSGGGYTGGGYSGGGSYGPLAKTGANTTLVVALSIALLLSGAAAVMVGKRGSLSPRK